MYYARNVLAELYWYPKVNIHDIGKYVLDMDMYDMVLY